MIKIYLFLFSSFFFFYNHSFAQNTPWNQAGGSIGIGTITPEQRLTVVMDGSTNGTGIAVKAVNSGSAGPQPGYSFLNPIGDKRMYNYLDVASDTYNIANANGINSISITQAGNVGIGTIAPEQKFSVVMDPYYNGTGIAVKAVNSGASGSQPGYSFLNPSGSRRVYNYLDVSSDSYNIGNATGAALVTVIQSGNMGIGTTAPDAKLAVNGSIHAKEVRVDLNVAGADYVFEKTYPLRSLIKVDKYISVNHHLPDVPSARSMEENGIDVSTMNMKLLQKVEELTLYLIDQQKQLKIQHKQIYDLQKKLTQKSIR